MKNNRSSWILLGLLLLFAIVYFSYKPENWDENYELENEGAYGLSVLAEIMQTFDGSREVIQTEKPFQSINNDFSYPSNYFIASDFWGLDSLDINALAEFVASGNTAFIASKELPQNFVNKILPELEDDNNIDNFLMTRLDSNLVFQLVDPKIKSGDNLVYNFYRQGYKIFHYLWSHMPKDWFSRHNSSVEKLGHIRFKNEELTNFASIQYGNGTFLLHSNPLVFTNFYLSKERHLEYVENLLSYLNEGPVIWDKYASEFKNRNKSSSSKNESTQSTPLKYVLSQPALAWAWYTILFMGLMYLIFRAKREQRIIPVLRPNTNTSLEYVKTIGQLYFQNGNPKQVSTQKMNYLQEHIRVRYHLQTNDWDAEFREKLAQKSGVAKELVDKIDFLYKNIQKHPRISEQTLMEFHNLLQEFYDKGK